MILVNPRSKKPFEFLRNFNSTKRKNEKLVKYGSLIVDISDLTNCFYFVLVITTFDTTSSVLW